MSGLQLSISMVYSYGPDHSKTEPFENRILKSSVFEWRSVLQVRFSSPHCSLVFKWSKVVQYLNGILFELWSEYQTILVCYSNGDLITAWRLFNPSEPVSYQFGISFQGKRSESVRFLSSLHWGELKGEFCAICFSTWTSNIIEWMFLL